MEEYTKRNLSWQCDILEVLSGITSALSGRYHEEFLFGLPEKSFDAALLWDTVGLFKPRVPEKPMVLPSWSWISHVGQVKHKFDKYLGTLIAWSACMDDNSCAKLDMGLPWMKAEAGVQRIIAMYSAYSPKKCIRLDRSHWCRLMGLLMLASKCTGVAG